MITIQYGPWLPDIASLGFQIQDQEGPVQVPLADCLNVLYANGNYYSTPSPVNATGGGSATLGMPVIKSMTIIGVDGNPYPVVGTSSPASINYWNVNSGWFSLQSVPSVVMADWQFATLGVSLYMLSLPVALNTASGILYTVLLGSTTTSGGVSVVSSAPAGQVMATVGQFLMMGDMYIVTAPQIGTGNGATTFFTFTVPAPILPNSVKVFTGSITGTDNGTTGVISGTGIASANINYQAGAGEVTFSVAPAGGQAIFVSSAQGFRSRLQWCAIGNGSSWPTPLTNAALAVQSGINDLEYQYGPIMFISGYPLYAVVFQRNAITRAQYIGGNVVFSWQTFARAKGLMAKGACIQVSEKTFFLADDGWFYTDGANVVPIGTAEDNSAGIDQWFFSNVNKAALGAIRSGYDAKNRCVMFSIPTGSNTTPDTLLSYNVISGRWTRSTLTTSSIWTDSDGSTDRIGLFNSGNTYQLLTGAPNTTAYLESMDIEFSDGLVRDTNGVRPNGNMTSPTVTVGVRNTLKQAVTYNAGFAPDAFGAGFAPALTEGLYTRIRVSDTNATSIQGATIDMVPGGPL